MAVLIPAFNCEDSLLQLIKIIRRDFPDIRIIVVDDGSKPALTFPEGIKERNFLLRRNETNKGKGYALRKGFQVAFNLPEVTHILTMDADLQHSPEHIWDFLRMGALYPNSIIYGCRHFTPFVMPWHRILSNTLTSIFISIRINQRIKDSQTGYRLIPVSVARKIHTVNNGFQMESEFLLKAGLAGYRFVPVPISTIYNRRGSHINHLRDTLQFACIYFQSYLWS